MNIPTLQLCAIGSALAVLLSACGTPAVYRPEVGEFQKAATEVSTYVTAKQSAVELVRADLREEVLKSRRPLIAVSAECAEAAKKLADQSSPVNEGKDCRLTLPDDPDLEQIFNPKGQFTDSAAFAQAVEEYASALYKVATSGDKEAFLQAANGLGDAVISLAGSAAEAAGKAKPDPSVILSLVYWGEIIRDDDDPTRPMFDPKDPLNQTRFDIWLSQEGNVPWEIFRRSQRSKPRTRT